MRQWTSLTIIVSGNGLSLGRRQTIIWTNAEILFIWTWGKNFSEILNEIHTLSFKKMHYKMSSEKWHQFCLCLNVLKIRCQTIQAFLIGFFHLNLTLSAFYFFVCVLKNQYFRNLDMEIRIRIFNCGILVHFRQYEWCNWDSIVWRLPVKISFVPCRLRGWGSISLYWAQSQRHWAGW